MERNKLTFTWKQLMYISCLIVFQFLSYFTEKNYPIKYFDEFFTIIMVLAYAIRALRGKINIIANRTLFLVALICIIGVIGNVTSGVGRNVQLILFDMFSCIRLFLLFAALTTVSITEIDWSKIIRALSSVTRLTIIIAFICAVLNQFVDFGMRDEYRYGLMSFKFIFINAGTLSTMCYGYMMILTLVIPSLKTSKAKKIGWIYIVLTSIVWASTLRTRAFGFIAFYYLVAFYYLKIKKRENEVPKNKRRVRVWQILISIATVFALSSSQFENYFTRTETARYQLLAASVSLANQHFPIGAGFATFGTNIAKDYYSPLYSSFGFNAIYGLSESMREFLTDNCWPAILGQFGYLGMIIYIILIFIMLKYLYKRLRYNEYYFVTILFYIVVFIGSSVATQTLFHYSTLGYVLLLMLLANKEESKGKIGVKLNE